MTANSQQLDHELEALQMRIFTLLNENQGLTEKHLRMLLEVDKRSLRHALRQDNRFVGGSGPKSRWHLAGQVQMPVVIDLESKDLGDREVIISVITEILEQQPGSTAQEFAELMGMDKSRVNHFLYNSNGRFIWTGPNPPRWFMANELEVAEELKAVEEIANNLSLSEDWFAALEREYEALVDGEGDSAGEIITIAPLNAPLIDATIGVEPNERIPFEVFKRSTEPRVPMQVVAPSDENPFALYAWQLAALAAWQANSSRGVIDAVTGAGKTRLAIAAIAQHTELEGKVVVVVPTISLIHQWYDAIERILPDLTLGLVGGSYDDSLEDVDVLISTVASARNRRFVLGSGEEGLLVADECHRMASTVNRQALDHRFTKRLGLSATHERMDDLHTEVLIPYFSGVVYALGYKEAIDDGVIANVRAAFVGVQFNQEESDSYAEMTQQLTSLRRKLISQFGCRQAPFSAFLDDVLFLTRKGDRQEGMAANKWLTTWRARRDLLAETPAKVEVLGEMVEAIRDSVGTMIFTQSIQSANDIQRHLTELGIATGVHHSEISDWERGEILEAFGERKLQAIVSVQTLEEGVDVPDADLAIIVAASKQRRQMIQRMGRVMRQKSDGRDARFVVVYVEGTDEDPDLGANEHFITELIDVARDVDKFEVHGDVAGFNAFLHPQRLV